MKHLVRDNGNRREIQRGPAYRWLDADIGSGSQVERFLGGRKDEETKLLRVVEICKLSANQRRIANLVDQGTQNRPMVVLVMSL